MRKSSLMAKRAQTSTEFIIIVAIILVILIFGASVVLDLPSISYNLKQSSVNRHLSSGDIGIIAYYFNSTSGVMTLKNNLDDIINLTVFVESSEVYSGLVLNPSEQEKISFSHSLEVLEYYSLDVVFEYVNLVNSEVYGYSVNLEGELS